MEKYIKSLEKLIEDANIIKFKLMNTSTNNGNTVLTEEQAQEIIRKFRDDKLKELLGNDEEE